MSLQDVVSNIRARARIENNEQDKAIEESLRMAAQAILLDRDTWTFMDGSHTQTATAGSATLTCTGSDNDCGVVEEIYFDGATVPLPYLIPEEFDRVAQGRTASQYGVAYWTMKTRSGKDFPVISFFGSNYSDDASVYYRYRKAVSKTDPVSQLPAILQDYVTLDVVIQYGRNLYPSVLDKLDKTLAKRKSEAFRQYRRKTGNYEKARLDPDQAARNQQINFRDHAGGYVSDGRCPYPTD